MTSPKRHTKNSPQAVTSGRVIIAAAVCLFALAAAVPQLAFQVEETTPKWRAVIVANTCLVNICNKKHTSIKLSVDGVSRSRPACYRWEVDGGELSSGEGAEVTWDFADEQPGAGKFYIARLTIGGNPSCGGKPVPAHPKRVFVYDCPRRADNRNDNNRNDNNRNDNVGGNGGGNIGGNDSRNTNNNTNGNTNGGGNINDANINNDSGNSNGHNINGGGNDNSNTVSGNGNTVSGNVNVNSNSNTNGGSSGETNEHPHEQTHTDTPTPTITPTPTPTPAPDNVPGGGGVNGRAGGGGGGGGGGEEKVAGWSKWVPPAVLAVAALGFGAYMLLQSLGVLGGAGGAGGAAAGGGAAAASGTAAAAAGTTKQADKVHCTVFGPRSARPGDDLLIQAFAHLFDQAAQLDALARAPDASAERLNSEVIGPEVERGKKIFFRFEARGLEAEEPNEQTVTWSGEPARVEFLVPVPSDAQPRRVAAKVIFGVVGDDGSRVASGHVRFMLDLVAATAPQPAATAPAQTQHLEQTLVQHKCAFISYARPNRLEVEKRVQAFRAAGLKCIMDAVSFEAGEEWEPAIRRYIDESDVFYLFWSSDASKSEWVNREIDLAFELSEDDDKPLILPVPLEDPSVVKPPEKLKYLHFDDPMLAHMDAEEMRQLRKQQRAQQN